MQYDFTLLAGGGQALDVKGRFFKYKSGLGAIRVSTDRGGFVDLLPGQGIRNTEFSRLVVTDRTGSGGYGVLIAGDFDFQDDRISGSVEVIDGGRSRTNANMAFMGVASMASGGVTMYSHGQLWNPAGSNVNAVIKRYSAASAKAGFVFAKIANAALTTLTGTGVSKKAGGLAAKCQLRTQADPGGIAGIASLEQFAIQASASQSVVLQEPLVLPPGYGLHMAETTVDADLAASFEWFEEGI